MSRSSANLLLLLAAMLWGAGNVCQKTALENLGPFTIVGFRCLIGVLVILPLLGQERVSRRAGKPPGTFQLAAIGVFFAAGMVCQQAAFATTTVANGSFLITTTTVLTPCVAWVLHRLWPSPIVWVAVTLALLGSFLMAGASLDRIVTGDLFCLLGALFYSVWFVLLGDAVVRSGQPVAIAIAQFVYAGVACIALGFLFEPVTATRIVAALPELVLLGVASTGIAFVIQAMAQQRATATEAAIIGSAEGVFGTFAAMLLLGEDLSAVQAIGAACITVAVLTVAVMPTPRAARLRDLARPFGVAQRQPAADPASTSRQ